MSVVWRAPLNEHITCPVNEFYSSSSARPTFLFFYVFFLRFTLGDNNVPDNFVFRDTARVRIIFRPVTVLSRRKDAFLHDVQKDNEMTSVEYSHVHKNDVAFMLIFALSYLEIRRYGVHVKQTLLLFNQTNMTLQFAFSIRWLEIFR